MNGIEKHESAEMERNMKQFWFVVGSQDLYGEEVLQIVAERAAEMAGFLTERLPYPLVYKVTAMSSGIPSRTQPMSVSKRTRKKTPDCRRSMNPSR